MITINKQYFILLEDTNKSFNLNMHSHECFASNMYEAIGKMVTSRVEFKNRKILKITSFDFTTKENLVEYIEADHENCINNALEVLNNRKKHEQTN